MQQKVYAYQLEEIVQSLVHHSGGQGLILGTVPHPGGWGLILGDEDSDCKLLTVGLSFLIIFDNSRENNSLAFEAECCKAIIEPM